MAVTTDTINTAARIASPSMYPVVGSSYIPTANDTMAATIRIWTVSSSTMQSMNSWNQDLRGEDGRLLQP